VKLNWSPLALLNVLIIVVLASTLFSTFSLIIACIVKTRERFMGVGQVLTMPLFFASNAIYPTDIMPGWLKTISHLNPLTYVVDALRTFMLAGSTSTFGLSRDYAVILLTTTLLVAWQRKTHQRVTEVVHQAGGRIFLQRWHMGRISHPSFQPGSGLPVAPEGHSLAGWLKGALHGGGFFTLGSGPSPLRRCALREIRQNSAVDALRQV
jgi:hypothetical protein